MANFSLYTIIAAERVKLVAELQARDEPLPENTYLNVSNEGGDEIIEIPNIDTAASVKEDDVVVIATLGKVGSVDANGISLSPELVDATKARLAADNLIGISRAVDDTVIELLSIMIIEDDIVIYLTTTMDKDEASRGEYVLTIDTSEEMQTSESILSIEHLGDRKLPEAVSVEFSAAEFGELAAVAAKLGYADVSQFVRDATKIGTISMINVNEALKAANAPAAEQAEEETPVDDFVDGDIVEEAALGDLLPAETDDEDFNQFAQEEAEFEEAEVAELEEPVVGEVKDGDFEEVEEEELA